MKPRVLYLTSEYSLKNGWGTCTVNWIEGLKQDVGYAEIATFKNAVNDKAPWPIHSVLRSFTNGRWKHLAMMLDAWQLQNRCNGQFDIVHSLIEPFTLLGDRLANKWGAKHMIQLIGTYSVSPVLTRFKGEYGRVYRAAESLISISDYTAQRVHEEYELLEIRTATLGVDRSIFDLASTIKKEPYFLFVGAIKPRKGLLVALKGFKDFIVDHPKYEFRVVGALDEAARYVQEVQCYVQQHQLPVRFLGAITHDELVTQFQSCTAHVLPSETQPYYFEGFGLVHLEANMCGALTIGSIDSANEEVIEEGVSGYLVPQEDPIAVAQAMLAAAKRVAGEEPRVRAQCVAHARKFSWDKSVQAIRDAYRVAGEPS